MTDSCKIGDSRSINLSDLPHYENLSLILPYCSSTSSPLYDYCASSIINLITSMALLLCCSTALYIINLITTSALQIFRSSALCIISIITCRLLITGHWLLILFRTSALYIINSETTICGSRITDCELTSGLPSHRYSFLSISTTLSRAIAREAFTRTN